MIKKILILILTCFMLSNACSSRKGNWNGDDRKQIEQICLKQMKEDSLNMKELEQLGIESKEFADKTCKCLVKKAEQAYNNAVDTEKDVKGFEKLAAECGGIIAKEMLQKK